MPSEELGKVRSISTGLVGLVWAINEKNQVFRTGRKGWDRMPGELTSVSVGVGTVRGLHAT